jgi:hypothetical protein
MKEWFGEALDEASSTLLRWAGVMAITLVMGFCAGYWVGHGEITGARKTLLAFAWLPLLWLGNPELFIAYAVQGVAWYLPPHYESRWLKIGSAGANLLVWFLVVYCVVVKTAHGKFFRY